MRLDSLAPSPEPTPPSPPAPGPCSASEPDQAAAIEGLAFEDEPSAEGSTDGAGAPGVLTREQFRAGLGAALGLSGGLLGLETLRGAPTQPTYPGAADALYDTALEVPWLRFLVSPDSIWLQRAIALGAFAVPVAAGCAAELRARRIPPSPASPAAVGAQMGTAERRNPAENGDSEGLRG